VLLERRVAQDGAAGREDGDGVRCAHARGPEHAEMRGAVGHRNWAAVGRRAHREVLQARDALRPQQAVVQLHAAVRVRAQLAPVVALEVLRAAGHRACAG